MGEDRLRTTWEKLGETDPLWAVLSHPQRRGGRWQPEEFFAHGQDTIKRTVAALAERGLRLGQRVLDFGCGVGRLSNALTAYAEEVTGVDIAESMIELAKEYNQHGDRIRFVHYPGGALPFPDASFDSAISLLVLQHAPPETQLAALLELRRVVRPGGVILVQIPGLPSSPAELSEDAYIARLSPKLVPEQLETGQSQLLRIAVTNDGEHSWRTGHRIRLGNHWMANDRMLIEDDGRADLPTALAGGTTAEVELLVTAPVEPGDYQLELDLVREDVCWFANKGSPTLRLPVRVTEQSARSPAPAPPPPEPAVADESGIEMHGLRTELVRELFNHCDCHVVDAVPDRLAGEEWDSYTYYVRRGHARL
ncbi:methyltransferase family protein [Tamaricihabitans halophyticus]|uniref:Methyltransferase family protein n=1 Tax=Tamaricihabitans halophyticus TaxID=1262583 RepID=A0A4R2R5V4_9PSEU|nr:class I SAM-dependent methyltransferase [Tamaricihabitans halophyticus]TCP57168.1 methyltransferase family protein [Tamaricihabitans halophyticus]